MAHAAITQLAEPLRADVVIAQKLTPAFDLVGGRFPRHIEDLVLWSDKLFRSFMAIETPAHIKRVRFPGDRHLVHGAVTGRAPNPFLDVNAVVEEHEVRSLVHPFPFNWLAYCQTLADGRQEGRILPHL